jgi:nucleotide-binding universal stress UspA family protein
VSPTTAEGVIQASHELCLAIRTALAHGIISRAEQETKDRHLSPVRSVVRDGDPATELQITIAEEEPDLFVIGRRGLGGFQRLLMGSVSSKISYSAECTLVLVK